MKQSFSPKYHDTHKSLTRSHLRVKTDAPEASPFITFSFLLLPRFSFQPDLISLGSWDLFLGPLLQAQTANQHGTGNPELSSSHFGFNTSLRWCKKLTCHPGSYLWYRTQLQNRLLLALGRHPLCEEETTEWGLASALLPRPGHKALQEH